MGSVHTQCYRDPVTVALQMELLQANKQACPRPEPHRGLPPPPGTPSTTAMTMNLGTSPQPPGLRYSQRH
jgi:hypothetical protein